MLLIDIGESVGDTDRTASNIGVGNFHIFRSGQSLTQLIAGRI